MVFLTFLNKKMVLFPHQLKTQIFYHILQDFAIVRPVFLKV